MLELRVLPIVLRGSIDRVCTVKNEVARNKSRTIVVRHPWNCVPFGRFHCWRDTRILIYHVIMIDLYFVRFKDDVQSSHIECDFKCCWSTKPCIKVSSLVAPATLKRGSGETVYKKFGAAGMLEAPIRSLHFKLIM